MKSRFAFILFILLPVSAGWAAPKPKKPHGLPVPKEKAIRTQASVTVAGQTLHYTATAGNLLLYNGKHKAIASVFYIAYTLNGVPSSRRPVTFAYNGGPGYASALVDIGGFGPRRLIWPGVGDAQAEQPPYRLVNNPYTILPATDLVFIDAVGTGYSRIVGQGKPKMFYGINADGLAFTQFIERYLKKYQRWNSPKFLLGESYGTTRSAVVANDLVNQGVYLNGVMMCSTVLDFPTINFVAGNDLPYLTYLPSYAASAWYHHRLHPEPATVRAAVAAAEKYVNSYSRALWAGDQLSPAKKQAVAAHLAQLTGIPARLWIQADLRLTLPVFMRRLMGPSGPMTGRYDDRFLTPELQPVLPIPGNSAAGASNTAINGALTASFDNYLTQDLHFTSSRLYKQNSNKVFAAWKWDYRSPLNALGSGVGNLHSRNVAPALARAMGNDPGMQLMMNNGYYDMATPFYATQYTIHHMGLTPKLERNVHWFYYPVGHMLYVNPRALPMLARNMDAFIQAAAK